MGKTLEHAKAPAVARRRPTNYVQFAMAKRKISEDSNAQEERLVNAAAELRRSVIELLEAVVAMEKSAL
jgi:hypothetical protein